MRQCSGLPCGTFFPGFPGGRADVGQHADIFHGKQGMIFIHGFGVGYIKACPPDEPLVKGPDKVILVVYRSPGRVDEQGVALHLLKCVVVEDPLGFRT